MPSDVPYLSDPDFTLWHGDVREVLPALDAESVDCALTSPPFYALRDYDVEGQIGLEATPEEWVDALVGVFREVRRILKPQGTLWVECGDSYASQGGPEPAQTKWQIDGASNTQNAGRSRTPGNLKAKDLIGAPWMLAFALRADGWWLRQCIVWEKSNAMPESVTDRCTTSHSYLFLLSKSPRYYFDSDAIAEPAEWARWGDQTVPKYEGTNTKNGWMKPQTAAELRLKASVHRSSIRGGRSLQADPTLLKNARSVWTVPTHPYPEAHFATWPEPLVERIINAGCPKGGVILDPFMGAGTSALVARRLGRRAIGVELNEDYCELAARRVSKRQQKQLPSDLKPAADGTLNLFGEAPV